MSATPALAREVLSDDPSAPTVAPIAVAHGATGLGASAAPLAAATAAPAGPLAGRVNPSSRGGLRPTSNLSTPGEFIAAVAGPAQESQEEFGVPAAVTIAQAILESEWGRSDLSKVAQNYFGIKALARPGPAGVIDMDTWEMFGGQSVTIDAPFKAYHNLEESVMDHGRFLKDNPRYADAFKVSDPVQFAQRIHQDGYATDPDYCDKIRSLIQTYRLDRYDVTSTPQSPAHP